MSKDSIENDDRNAHARNRPSKFQELIDFYENASLAQLGIALLMLCTFSFTTWSVGKGLWPHFGNLSIIIVFVLMASLVVVSFFAADRLVNKAFFTAIPLLVIVTMLAGIAGAASFNYLYSEASSRTDWISKDAQRAIGGFEKYFIEAKEAADTILEKRVKDFRDIPSVSGYAATITAAEEELTRITQESASQQSLSEALLKQLKENHQILVAEINQIPQQLSKIEDEIIDANVALKRLKDRAPEEVSVEVLEDLLQKLELAIDYEHRDPSTSVVRDRTPRVKDPDHARITLHEANDKLPIEISPDACGTLPTAEQIAQVKDLGYAGRERTFGKGRNGGGPCTKQLERLTREIRSYRDGLQEHEGKLSEAQQKLDELKGRQNELLNQEKNKRKELTATASRIANPGDVEPRLVELLGHFHKNPNKTSFDDLVGHCKFLVNTTGSLEVLKGTLGKLVCENGNVVAELAQLDKTREQHKEIVGVCSGSSLERAIRQKQAGKFSGTTVNASVNLQSSLKGLQDKEFSKCIDAARAFKAEVADTEADAATYITNNGWSDPLTTEINRYLDVWTLKDTKIGSYTILLVVMIIELSFAMGKISISWLGSKSGKKSVGKRISVSYPVAVALANQDPVRLSKGRYQFDPDVTSRIADPELRIKVGILLDDYIARGMAEEGNDTVGVILSSDAWAEIANVAAGVSTETSSGGQQSTNETFPEPDIPGQVNRANHQRPGKKRKGFLPNSKTIGGLNPGFGDNNSPQSKVSQAKGDSTNPFFQDVWLGDDFGTKATS